MTPEVTFVCCIEAGRLEDQTVMMAESLRQFGGSLSHCPIIAVMARYGPPLSHKTHERLHAIGVEVVHYRDSHIGYEWFGYSNKVKAVEYAQNYAKTDQVVWLDSDILVVSELASLVLDANTNIAVHFEPLIATVSDINKENQPYWRELCRVVGVEYSKLPWLERDGVSQLVCFNSGVVVWRRDSSFVKLYVDSFKALLRSRIAQCGGSFFAADQVIISPVIVKGGLTWRYLSSSEHRIVFPPLLTTSEGEWVDANILHYSGSLSGKYKPIFLERLDRELPQVANWLMRKNYLQVKISIRKRTILAALKAYRGVKWKIYTRLVKCIC